MHHKWIAVIAFWTAFAAVMIYARHAADGGKSVETALIVAIDGVILALAWVVLMRCILRRSTEPFWRGRGLPRWFLRFAADESDSLKRPVRPPDLFF